MTRRRVGHLRHHPTPQQRRQRRSFTPFHAPARPPSGTYDPALDAQERAGNRGLADLVQDIGQGGRMRERATTDYGLGLAEIKRSAGYATQDLDRGLTRAVQDHGTATGLLHRSYGLLGQAQGDAQAAAGVEQGGTVLAAAMRRRENEGIEQGGLDTQLSRYRADDTTNRARLMQNVAQQRGVLGLAYGRQGEDFTTDLARAQRENTQFDVDLSEQRFYQAKGTGYKPPSAPGNEHSRGPVTYRVSGQGPGRKYTLPTGQQLSRDEWVNLWRWRKSRIAAGHPGTGGLWRRYHLPGSGALSG